MSFVIHFIMWMELVKGEQKGKSNKQNWNFSRRREVVVFFVCSSKEFHYCFVINEQHDDKRFEREHFLLIRRPSWSLKSFFFLFCHPISLFLFSTSLNQVCIRSVSAKVSSEPFFSISPPLSHHANFLFFKLSNDSGTEVSNFLHSENQMRRNLFVVSSCDKLKIRAFHSKDDEIRKSSLHMEIAVLTLVGCDTVLCRPTDNNAVDLFFDFRRQ